MGTRADFYVGRGEDAEWLGSIAWDGYPDGIARTLLDSAEEGEFRTRLRDFFAGRDDVTLPENGWPWPWETSHTTDFAYAFDAGRVWASGYGYPWQVATEYDGDHDEGEPTVFPDMTARKNVQFGGKRSGLIIVSAKP
jgi:hypothetical protein